ncbi:hypothetical protein Patl1_19205 [Pistacia atlantica]|uniref:Uncharacterized protein n=1 Tax=Pistacia atlantica TaxID=434234 RepID=A0ACC1C2A3_9ROSI|nr:hypothetical protein Patl1_19205 [Pistacia atlantica]
MGNISSLQSLSLTNNSLPGSLPDDVCNHLPNLESLTLSLNGLSGQLPASLAGLLPSSIFNISSLELIHLGNSGLFGSLPTDICNHLPALRHLRLSRNMISGTIPKNINNCTSLEFFCLDENRLTGEIPDEIGNLQSLRHLALGSNGLTGRNKLTGTIPNSISNASKLTFGSIPVEIGNLHSLLVLDLSMNDFEWIYSNNCGKITQPPSANDLSGRIQPCLVRLISLRYLYLDSNRLTSDIPSALWSLKDILCRCRRKNSPIDEVDLLPLAKWRRTSYLEIRRATDDFSECNLLGTEYGSMGIASTRGDVYSFGVLLMENFHKKKPTDEMFVGEMSLKNLVESSLPHAVLKVVDANLLRDQNPFDAKVNCMLSIMDLALNCSMESLEQRINMKDALAKLKKIKLQFHKDVGAPN